MPPTRRLSCPGRSRPKPRAGRTSVPTTLLVAAILASATLVPAAARPLAAQELAAEPAASVAREVARRIQTGDRLRLQLASGEVIEGRTAAWIDEWVLMRDGRRIAASDILVVEALRRRTGHYARYGALLGLLAGAGLAVALDEAGSDSNRRAATAVFAVSSGGLGGAALGALFGAHRTESEVLYTAPAASPPRMAGDLIEYRLGPAPGRIRTRLAVTPIIGFASHSMRARHRAGNIEYGMSSSQQFGVQLQFAVSPRMVTRLGAATVHSHPQLVIGSQRAILRRAVWLWSGELGLELRMRSDVPGYFVLAADALYHPDGFIVEYAPHPDPDRPYATVRPTGIDAGVTPRLGAGFGFDVFASGDRRLRIEWLYRLGLYSSPASLYTTEATRLTRDATFTLGLHLPLLRPAPAPER